MADGLQQWWDTNEDYYVYIRQLVINLDNGPENSSFGTQFMNRVVEFADRNNLEFVLVYYLPYHSKYNPIERCWGILEDHWNAARLNTRVTVLEWAHTMTGKGVRPIVELLDRGHEKGVRIAKMAFQKIEERLKRDDSLPQYSGHHPTLPKLNRIFLFFASCLGAVDMTPYGGHHGLYAYL